MSEEEINNVYRFRTFPVYQDARKFRKKLKDYSKKHFPKEEQYNLTSQLWRAMDSVLLNIAEGSNRYSGRANSNFINISLGSQDEVAGCIDAAFDDGYMNKQEQLEFLSESAPITEQLRKFSASIRRNNRQN